MPFSDSGETSAKVNGIVPKVKSLLNNEMLSNVEFIFEENGSRTKLFGHKLILALGSDYFASCYYEKQETLKINLPACEKPFIFKMLKFLYIDSVDIQSFEEAQGLLSIAKKYSVKELESECIAFLLKDLKSLNAVLFKYEIALKNNIESLLSVCRKFTCEHADEVLKNDFISVMSAEVIIDIVQLENLSVSSEMVVLEAVMNWGKEKSKASPSSLKSLVYPFFKHIRFLTLTDDEFHSFLEEYDIFTPVESSILMRKILKPHLTVAIPEQFSSISYKRCSLLSSDIKKAKEIKKDKVSELDNAVSEQATSADRHFHLKTSPHTAAFHLIPEKTSWVDSKGISSSPNKMLTYVGMKPLEESGTQASEANDLSTSYVYPSHLKTSKPNSFDLKTISAAYNLPYVHFEPKVQHPTHFDSKLVNYGSRESVSSSSQITRNSSSKQSAENTPASKISLAKISFSQSEEDLLQKYNSSVNEEVAKRSVPVHSKVATSSEAIDHRNMKQDQMQRETTEDGKKFAYEIKKQHSIIESNSSTSEKYPRDFQRQVSLGESRSMFVERYSSNSQFAHFQSIQRTFDFPLKENRRSLSLSFKKDMKCSINFVMKAGSLKVSGFELFIQNSEKNKSEKINIEVDLEGFSQSSWVKRDLQQNALLVTFKEPVVLVQEKGALTVSVDELYSNRCRSSSDKHLEIKSGPNWSCNLSLKSNVKTEDDSILFLFNKLFYAM